MKSAFLITFVAIDKSNPRAGSAEGRAGVIYGAGGELYGSGASSRMEMGASSDPRTNLDVRF